MAHKIILDTDPGVDDVLALFLLLSSPETSIEAITVSFGNTSLPKAVVNILKVYQVIDRHLKRYPHDAPRFPGFNLPRRTVLAAGAAGPLEGELDLAEYFHGPDGLSGISDTHPEFDVPGGYDARGLPVRPEEHSYLETVTSPAWDVIISILDREPPHTVSVLAVGPLTNIALALRKSPSSLARAKRIVSMGGAFDVPGNTSPSAEFNFFADPYAATEVLQAATRRIFSYIQIPLDITSKHPIPFASLIPDRLPAHPTAELELFISTILQRPRRVLKDLGYMEDTFEMHDPFAAWFVIIHSEEADIKVGWNLIRRKFMLERKGEWTKGLCVVDRRGSTEAAGSVRAKDGIVISGSKEEKHLYNGIGLAVHVLDVAPDPVLFAREFLKRVCWYADL